MAKKKGWDASGECLALIGEKLETFIPMDGCPPMFYPEAIHNLFVWSVKAGRDCQKEHDFHGKDEALQAACLREKIRKYATEKNK